MANGTEHKRLKKELSLFGVYAIATGTTLSAGFFLLPGLAAAEAGPAVVLCYLIAAALLVPAMFSIVELATAMPRAGGGLLFFRSKPRTTGRDDRRVWNVVGVGAQICVCTSGNGCISGFVLPGRAV